MSSSTTNTQRSNPSSWQDVEAERWQQIVAEQPPMCDLFHDAEASAWLAAVTKVVQNSESSR